MLAISQWTGQIPRRPDLPDGCSVTQLIALGSRRKRSKVYWMLAQSEKEVRWVNTCENNSSLKTDDSWRCAMQASNYANASNISCKIIPTVYSLRADFLVTSSTSNMYAIATVLNNPKDLQPKKLSAINIGGLHCCSNLLSRQKISPFLLSRWEKRFNCIYRKYKKKFSELGKFNLKNFLLFSFLSIDPTINQWMDGGDNKNCKFQAFILWNAGWKKRQKNLLIFRLEKIIFFLLSFTPNCWNC